MSPKLDKLRRSLPLAPWVERNYGTVGVLWRTKMGVHVVSWKDKGEEDAVWEISLFNGTVEFEVPLSMGLEQAKIVAEKEICKQCAAVVKRLKR